MKKIEAEELKPGDVFLDGESIKIVVKLAAANAVRFMHIDGDVMDNLNPRFHFLVKELYLITTLEDIGEIIKESLDES